MTDEAATVETTTDQPAAGPAEPRYTSDAPRSKFIRLEWPIEFDGKKAGKRHNPPAIGEHTRAVLRTLGYGEPQIDAMLAAGSVRG